MIAGRLESILVGHICQLNDAAIGSRVRVAAGHGQRLLVAVDLLHALFGHLYASIRLVRISERTVHVGRLLEAHESLGSEVAGCRCSVRLASGRSWRAERRQQTNGGLLHGRHRSANDCQSQNSENLSNKQTLLRKHINTLLIPNHCKSMISRIPRSSCGTLSFASTCSCSSQ